MRAGLALEQRAQLLSHFWVDHLSQSRAAQARWAQSCHGDVLTVLGAGNLADFQATALIPRFKRFRLVDGNPLSKRHWARLAVPVEPVITDLTGCVDVWCHEIRSARNSWDETLVQIRRLPQRAAKAYSAPSDAVLSLNVLSQLDVGWQDALEPVLQERFGRSFVRQREPAWLESIRPASQALVEGHLSAIEDSGAQFVLLITDVDLVEYRGRRYSRGRFEEPPVAWVENKWQAGEGVTFEVFPTLEGVPLDASTFRRFMPSYKIESEENWLWHIAPHGTEAADFGKLHRVVAITILREIRPEVGA